MKTHAHAYLSDLELGPMQTFDNMTVVPLCTHLATEPTYSMLSEALAEDQVTVTEVDDSGSVPDIKVHNHSDRLVLLLSGEELEGAKQNRVLNTTILIKGSSEIIVPVSCTEQGRWSAHSEHFSHSGVSMDPKLRSKVSDHVSYNLVASGVYESDQTTVWNEIETINYCLDTSSETGAMHDAYKQRSSDLDHYVDAFTKGEGQCGLLVFINGEIAGLDALAYAGSYEKVHEQLVRSYAMRALLYQNSAKVDGEIEECAKDFIEQTAHCTEQSYDSVGLGDDHRYAGAALHGMALVYEEQVMHTSFFRRETD